MSLLVPGKLPAMEREFPRNRFVLFLRDAEYLQLSPPHSLFTRRVLMIQLKKFRFTPEITAAATRAKRNFFS